MRKFIIASHGKFADGIADSLRLIVGDLPNVSTICAYMDGSTDTITAIFEERLTMFAPEDEIVVFTDIIGGSVNQQLMAFLRQPNVHIISGMNLTLILSIVLAEPELSLHQAVTEGVQFAQKGIVYVNSLLQKGGTL